MERAVGFKEVVVRQLYQDRVERVNFRFERRFGRSLRPGEIVRVLAGFENRLREGRTHE